jgi:hypothetical protein
MRLAEAVLRSGDVEEAERAFAALAAADIHAANDLARVLIRAIPQSGPMWTAILRQAMTSQLVDQYNQEQEQPKPIDWGQTDAADTADGIAARMGWRDVERQGA